MDISSSDSDEEQLLLMNAAAATVLTMTDPSSITSAKYRGGSQPGRAANRDFNVHAKNIQLDVDYFCRYRKVLPYSASVNSSVDTECRDHYTSG